MSTASLSSKAKGKGKAKATPGEWSESDQDEQPQSPSWPATFIIKFSDNSLQDLTLDIDNVLETTVSDLKKLIRQQSGGITVNRRLRLIHSGRVINDQTDLARDVAKVNLSGQINRVDQPVPRVYIHCSIGDILSSQELARESEYDSRVPHRSTLPELRGFDRLRATGFTEEDVADLRRQFNALYGTNPSQNPDEAARLEEEWIDTGVGDAPTNNVVLGGDYLDDLVGVLMGMFLGVLALFFFKESSTFSPRQQRVIFFGIAINFFYAVMRMLA
uniref:ARAD1D29304p n=1 Tax=Blastobotrys adeninivorans TaxID=409370 RepID=A0A060TBR4_BLAAD